MRKFPSTKAREVLKALLRRGWKVKRQEGSHKILAKEGYNDFPLAYHESEEISPVILKKIAKYTDLQPEDL